MPVAAPFRLNRSGLMLAIISAAFASQTQAASGRAEFTIGGVTVARGGVERPLARGTELDNGDVVRTNDGRAQIRFTDGSYVSLQPNTEYGIRDYQYTQGNERGFFSLLKGAMRTVTGAIGRINRDRFQIATPTATVGIRGTGGVIQVQDDGSTLVIGTSGIWSLTNPAGSVDVPAGNSAVAPADPNQPPQETTQQPTSGPAPIPEEEPEFVAGEEVDEQGLPVIPQPTVLVSGSGFEGAGAWTFTPAGASPQPDIGGGPGSSPITAVFNAAGQATQLDVGGDLYRLEAGGSHADFGTDGLLAWGRWIGPATVTSTPPAGGTVVTLENYSANQGFHYVVGMPTASMPVSGSATYSLLGATQPTDGSAAGTFTGGLSVVFGPSTVIDGNFNVAIAGRGYAWTARTSTASHQFSMSSLFNATSGGTGGACLSSCTASVFGFFAGTTAERAGISYHINESGGAQVIGAAAFTKN